MFRKALMHRIWNQIAEQESKLELNKGVGKHKIEQSIHRKHSLLRFLMGVKADKVDMKDLENKFRVKLSG